MKRLCYLAVLMLLSSSAYAGNSFSFSVGGHRIRIEAPRHCSSASCANVSISGIYQSRRKRDRFEDDSDAVEALKPLAPAQAQPAVPVAPAAFRPAAVATQEVAAPPPPLPIQPARITPPLAPPPVEKPAEAVPSVPVTAPQVSKVSHDVEDEPANTPVGDWQTQGKGAVRIAPCGRALCGYVLNSSSNDKGEAVLINMKPKTDSRWIGNVYSHDSGATYYGTMDMQGPNTIRVEACALGRFYCAGNVWTRVDGSTARLVTARQISPAPRS